MGEPVTGDPLREELAALAHEQWSGWMQYLFSKGDFAPAFEDKEGLTKVWIMPAWAVERWTRQMNTAYADLPEEEKASDRLEADKVLAVVRGRCLCGCRACDYCEKLLEAE